MKYRDVFLMYGMVMFACAMIGFLMTHSKTALLTGGVGSVVLFVCYMLSEKNIKGAETFGTTITYLLTILFAWRFFVVYSKLMGCVCEKFIIPTVILGMLTATGFLASAMLIRIKQLSK